MFKKHDPVDGEIELIDLVNRLESIEELIRENNLLIRILAQPVLLSTLQGVFHSSNQLRAYELSNGERSTREIGKLIKRDQKGVSNWWREWEKLGIGFFRWKSSCLQGYQENWK